MARGILEFDLDTEPHEFHVATRHMSLKLAIEEIFNEVFRRRIKYEIPETELAMSHHDYTQKLREECWQIIIDNSLTEVIE